MPNIERLKTLLEYVRTLPVERIDMREYKSKCGTTCCLLGHAVGAFPDQLFFKPTLIENLCTVAEIENPDTTIGCREFFGLNEFQWHRIFDPSIGNDVAVSNLAFRIEDWSNAQH